MNHRESLYFRGDGCREVSHSHPGELVDQVLYLELLQEDGWLCSPGPVKGRSRPWNSRAFLL